MTRSSLLLFLTSFLLLGHLSNGQTNDSIKYLNVVKYIQQDKGIEKYRNKYFYKKAKKFRVSEHVIYNYYPLRFFENQLDSLGIKKSAVDSLCALEKDTISTISFAPKLSAESKSDYILYFGKPVKNLLFVVIENDKNEKENTKYDGVCCRPLIILLVFDANGNVTKAYCSAPIID